MSAPKILITDDVHPLLRENLMENGFDVHLKPEVSRTEVLSIIHNYYGLVINSRIKADAELLHKADQLKFVARIGSGLEVMDVPLASSLGIDCINAPEGNRNAVAEHALGSLLALMNHIPKSFMEIKNGEWKREENRGEELYGKTIGLIAYGNTARSFSKRLSGFNLQILAYDKYITDYSDEFVEESTLNEISENADVVSVHLPLTNETHHVINEEFFLSLKKKIWFVNTSRGLCVDTTALIKALKLGIVKGAALDVLENEKLESLTSIQQEQFNWLKQQPNVILTPHIAGWTVESKKRIAEVLAEKIVSLNRD